MRRSGRLLAAILSVVAVAAIVLPGAEAQKVLNPGPFNLLPLGGTISIRNTAFDLTPRALPECSDGFDNDADGLSDLADPFCSALFPPVGTTPTAAADDSELAQYFQPKVNVSINGTIDASGNLSVPPSGIVFPPAYIGIKDPGTPNFWVPYQVIYVIKASVLPTATATGSLNPLTGDAALQVKVKVQLEGSAFDVGLGYNCSIGTATAPLTLNLTTANSGGLFGTKYSSTSGTARLVDNTFAVPGASGCPIGLVNVNDIINQQILIPSPAGSNNAILDGQASPVLGKGVAAKITTTPALLSGPAPFTVDFSAATSTVAKAPASYLWQFPDGTTSTGVTATKTFSTVGTQTVTLTVTDGDGDSSVVTKNVAVTPGGASAPVVSGVSPSSGPTAGGTTVTITGSNLTGASAVSFGGVAATGVTVVNASTVTAVSPPGAAGTVDVRVTTPGGQSVVSAGDKFTYQAPPVPTPVVSGVSPSSGPTAGGTTVTITGSNLTGASAVSFGGVAATGVTVVNASTVTAVSPPGAAGTVDVRVTTPGGQSVVSAGDKFTYQAPPVPTPVVSGVSPSSGPTAGGTTVTITGSNLTGASAVSFGGVAATGVTVVNASTVTAVSPPGAAGTVDVRVTTPGGQSVVSAGDKFTYQAPPVPTPVVSGVSPSSGPTAGGTTVTITGSNLTGASAVSFGGVAATGVTVVNASTVTAVSPPGAAGTVDVRVTTPGGQSVVSAGDKFTYQAPPVPTPVVSGVSPSSGPTAGGTTVTITGSNLTGASAVSFGGVAATGVTVVNASTVTAVSPPGAAGTVDVRVTTPGGQSVVSAGDKFTYQAPPGGNADRASVQISGSVSYTNSGDNASGTGVRVVRDQIGLVSAAGTVNLPGTSGGTSRFTVGVQRFWVFQLWTGQVSVYDPNASVSLSAPVFGTVSPAPGTNAVGGTSSWFYFGQFPNLVKPFTLRWSVDDVS